MGLSAWVAAGAAVLVLGAAACSRLGGIKPAQAAELAQRPGTLVLDVRTLVEYEGGHLPSAVLIPIQQLPGRLAELPQDKKTPILVYCAVGGRSAAAAGLLKAKGYENVSDLSGGISAWESAGLPVVK